MSMLNQIMANVMNRAGSHRGGTEREDPTKKEERAAYRRMLENAVKPDSGYSKEQISALAKNAPAGVDPSIYTTLAGMQSPAQQAKNAFNERVYGSFLQMLNGGQPVQQSAQPSTPSTPAFTPSGSIQVPQRIVPASSKPTDVPANLFTLDFVFRKVTKDLAGIDVGGHYLESPKWFESYDKRVKNGAPVSQAISDTAVEYGFIPDGASNLKELSDPERKAIFEREFSTAIADPTLDAIVQKYLPKGVNPQKAKAGLILNTFAEQGRYIPDHYQPFLDRFRGLEDPEFVGDDLKTRIYQDTGKMPSEITPSDVAKARKAIQDDAVLQAMRQSYAQTTGRTKAENDLELSKPISAEDRAKYGIDSAIKTYQQLADEGKRFPTEADRKMYQELYTARERLLSMKNLLFGTEKNPSSGIFTGIDVATTARTSAKARLAWEKWNGTQRGRNLEEYNDYVSYFARSLIKIAGESGSRLSDQDIKGIVSSMSDTGRGFDLPDSEALARSKFERAATDMARLMKLLEDTTTVMPTKQPTTPAAPQYEVGKVYTDAQGRKAKYVGGDKPWQMQP